MGKRRIGWALLLLAGMVLAGCGHASSGLQGRPAGETSAIFFDRGKVVLSQNGLLRSIEGMQYTDFASGETVYLCNKEGCRHDSKGCNASLIEIGGDNAFFYDGMLYVVASQEINKMSLWQMSADGTNRKEIIEDISGNGPKEMFLLGDTLYMCVYYEELEQGEAIGAVPQHDRLVACGLKDHTVRTVMSFEGCEYGESITYIKAVGEDIYYQLSGYSEDILGIVGDPDITEQEMQEELKKVDILSQICRYSPDTEKTEILYESRRSYEEAQFYGCVGVTQEGEVILQDAEKGLCRLRDGEPESFFAWTDAFPSDSVTIGYVLCGPWILAQDSNGEMAVLDGKTGEVLMPWRMIWEGDEWKTAGLLGYYDGKIWFSLGLNHRDIAVFDMEKLAQGQVERTDYGTAKR